MYVLDLLVHQSQILAVYILVQRLKNIQVFAKINTCCSRYVNYVTYEQIGEQ